MSAPTCNQAKTIEAKHFLSSSATAFTWSKNRSLLSSHELLLYRTFNEFLKCWQITFSSSFSRLSLMASTFDASLSRVHPPPTTIPSSTAA